MYVVLHNAKIGSLNATLNWDSYLRKKRERKCSCLFSIELVSKMITLSPCFSLLKVVLLVSVVPNDAAWLEP